MSAKIGYLLPTRERIMEGRPETDVLLALAERAESLGYASVWVGDSLLARPRHEPLSLLAAVAGRTKRVEMGTAVLLPALRNPVLLAHQVATLDQVSEGRLILGVGFAADLPNIRAEFVAAGVPFERRIGRMLEGVRLCRALWTGEPVDWDGRWQLRGAVLAPTPRRPGGPPIWLGGNLPASLERVGRWFDGWFPTAQTPALWAEQWGEVQALAQKAGRDPAALTGAIYLTLAVDDDAVRAEAKLNSFLEHYYRQPAAVMRARQVCYAGPVAGAAAWIAAYVKDGVEHVVLRFAGEHERSLEALAEIASGRV
jgi:alkanesulfonate monooxygenase SsuD/methylene tetrahydromethanopterin reductase-like flavin-dependent oxidoreductase (luciferase family)